MHNKIKVLYILGYERCGSTLLDRVLGKIDGFLAAGEVRDIWRNLMEPRRCGCGVRMPDCEFWKTVLDDAFGGIDQIDLQQMTDLCYQVSVADCLLTSFPWRKQLLTSRLGNYLTRVEKLYQAIQSVTGSKVIVDSSKEPVYGLILKMLPAIEPYFVHLIRDPRGIQYSLLRRKIEGDPTYVNYNSVQGSLLWNKRCLAAETLFRYPSNRYLMLRYEDFVNKPQEAVERILNLVQEEVTQLTFAEDGKLELNVSHTAGGSPSRFQSGIIELQPDERWKEKLKPADKAICTTLTGPLLLQYGYVGANKLRGAKGA